VQGGEEARERQAYDVEVTAFNAGNVTAGAALNAVSPCFIVRLFGGEVARDFIRGEGSKVNQGGFDKLAALCVGKANQGDSGDDGMGAAGKFVENVVGISCGPRLAEDVSVESDDRVCGDDNGRADRTGSHQIDFGTGEALHKIGGGFVGVRGLVHSGRKHGERKTGIAHDFGAARRGGGENQIQENRSMGRILQTNGSRSCAEGQEKLGVWKCVD
jgi:hypothetical protein